MDMTEKLKPTYSSDVNFRDETVEKPLPSVLKKLMNALMSWAVSL